MVHPDVGKADDFLLTQDLLPFMRTFLTYSQPIRSVGLWVAQRDANGSPQSLTCMFNQKSFPVVVDVYADGTIKEHGSSSNREERSDSTVTAEKEHSKSLNLPRIGLGCLGALAILRSAVFWLPYCDPCSGVRLVA